MGSCCLKVPGTLARTVEIYANFSCNLCPLYTVCSSAVINLFGHKVGFDNICPAELHGAGTGGNGGSYE